LSSANNIRDWLSSPRAHALGGGLLCGGHGQDELGQTGAYRVYEDPAEKLSVKTASVSREL